ncbi:TfpX/TfpZ family type IV pilin accessory protein [Roseateles chitinivorans]|uniref:TfpX/TfpZ family type IV pilin accessory protein n=1 Tax=Roseateles chitinivorans TaxID=2917965 RepID=UPI003D670B6C
MTTSMKAPFEWRRRAGASAVHLLSCLVVAALVAALVLLLWYPWPYRVISGGEKLLFLVMGVDIVMGPLITLAIFDIRKPMRELKRDLTIIVALQLAALGYGLHTVYIARPAVLALEGQRFRVTTANDVASEELPRAVEGLRSLSLDGPRLVATAEPSDTERGDVIFNALAGSDIGSRPLFWRPWGAEGRQQALKVARQLQPLMARAKDRAALDEAIARTGKPVEQLAVIPMIARSTDWSVLIDKTSGDPVGFAPLDGF